MKFAFLIPVLLCAGCVVRYDHTFLRSGEDTASRLGRGELAVSAAGEGSGARTRPPWALRFTGEAPRGRGSFILVKDIRATLDGRVFTHPDIRLDFTDVSWAQTLTGHFIPAPRDAGEKVTVSYRIVSGDSPRREIPREFRFHIEKSSGVVVANPLLDFT